jgi:hypothetical protein
MLVGSKIIVSMCRTDTESFQISSVSILNGDKKAFEPKVNSVDLKDVHSHAHQVLRMMMISFICIAM